MDSDYSLVSHLCEKHENYPPLERLQRSIAFPFVCTECRARIKSIKSYLHHILNKHKSDFKEIAHRLNFGSDNLSQIPETVDELQALVKTPVPAPFSGIITFFDNCKKRLWFLAATQHAVKELEAICNGTKHMFVKPVVFYSKSWQLVFLYLGHKGGIVVLDFAHVDHGQDCGLTTFFQNYVVLLAATSIEKAVIADQKITFQEVEYLENSKFFNDREFFRFMDEFRRKGGRRVDYLINRNSDVTSTDAASRPLSFLMLLTAIVYPFLINKFIEEKNNNFKQEFMAPPEEEETALREEEVLLTPHYAGEVSKDASEVRHDSYYRRQQEIARKRYGDFQNQTSGAVMETPRPCPMCRKMRANEADLYYHLYSDHENLHKVMASFRSPLSDTDRKHICFKCSKWFKDWRPFTEHVAIEHREELLRKTKEVNAQISDNMRRWVDQELNIGCKTQFDVGSDDELPTRDTCSYVPTEEDDEFMGVHCYELPMMQELSASDEYSF